MANALSPTFLAALENTHKRLQAMLEDGSANEQQIVEALAGWMVWTMTVDDGFKQGDPGYEGRRRQDPGGNKLPGLRYAWNRLKHDAINLRNLLLVERAQGRRYPRRYPWSYQDISWLDLPPSGHASQYASYRAHLAGKPVRHLAQDVTSFLEAEAARP